MKIYWSPNAIPELQAIPVHARKTVWEQAFRQAMGEKNVLKALIAMVIIVPSVVFIATLLVDWKPFNLGVIMLSVGGGIMVYTQMIYKSAIPHIARIFAEQYPQK
jgi:hypothetical protein